MSTDDSRGSGGGVSDTADAAKQSGQAVVGSAADHAKDLAGTASDKASDVIGEARSQASDLLDTAREQLGSEAENRRGQAVTSLRAVGDELDAMKSHDGDHGVATELVARGSQYVRQTADWLDGREPSQILDDVRRFARERPGTFLLGALLAGVVAGRLTRAVKAGAPPAPPASNGSSVNASAVNGSEADGYDPNGSTAAPRHQQDVASSAPFASSQGHATTPGFPPVADVDDDGYLRASSDDLSTPVAGRSGTL